MNDERLVAIVDAEFSTAMGAPGGDISTERARAWDYYLAKPLGNEVEGESSVVTSDVADVVDGIMPSLLRIFTTSDNLVSFDAVGPEDEAQAEQESDYINHVFFKQNDAFETLYVWFFDALCQKNGIVKAWWDESETVSTESYSGLTLEELVGLLDDPELQPVERAEREPGPGEIPGSDGLVHDVEFRRVVQTGTLCVDNVPPDEYRISADARRLDPTRARMVGHEREVTRTELIEMGFDRDLVESLPTYIRDGRGPQGGEERISRYDRQDERSDSAHEESMDFIQLREAYIRVDYDDDGLAELRRVLIAGGEVLLNEPADRQPFHVISPQPLPHKHFGRASSEKVMDVQEVSTTLLRQVLNNLYQTNNPQHAVWEMGMGDNTLDDLMTSRVGSIKRFARPVAESYSQITVPFTAGASFPMLDYFNKVKRDRTGISSDSEGLSPDALKNIQQSVMMQASDSARMKIEAVARIFAETGIRSLFEHIRELLMKHSQKADVVRLRSRWVQVDPRGWRNKRNVTINIGLGIGSRDSNLMMLEAIWQKQSEMVAGGGMGLTVTPRNIYATAAEIVKNANYKTPEMFFTDPGDQMAPPPSDQQQELQRQQQELVARQQQLDAQQMQIREQKLDVDRQKLLFETERKGQEFLHKREHDNAKLMLEAQKVASDVRSARTEDEIKAAKLRMDELMTQLDAALKRAQTAKTAEEARSLDIDNDATESGVTEALEGLMRMREAGDDSNQEPS